MPELKFYNHVYQVEDFDTVLNTLLKNGHAIPNFCRSGICHSCMMKAEEGTPLPFTQIGLSEELVNENYFLTCQCAVYAPMRVARPEREKRTRFVAMVREKTFLGDKVVKLMLSPEHEFVYQAGQFTTLHSVDGLSADFPIASAHCGDEGEGLMEFHIEKLVNNPLSHYLFDELEVGDGLEVQTALGESYYKSSFNGRDLVIIGVDSALAGGLSFVRQAMTENHQGNIDLIGVTQRLNDAYLEQAIDADIQAGATVFHRNIETGQALVALVTEQLQVLPASALVLLAVDAASVPELMPLSKDRECLSLAAD